MRILLLLLKLLRRKGKLMNLVASRILDSLLLLLLILLLLLLRLVLVVFVWYIHGSLGIYCRLMSKSGMSREVV